MITSAFQLYVKLSKNNKKQVIQLTVFQSLFYIHCSPISVLYSMLSNYCFQFTAFNSSFLICCPQLTLFLIHYLYSLFSIRCSLFILAATILRFCKKYQFIVDYVYTWLHRYITFIVCLLNTPIQLKMHIFLECLLM